MILPDIQAARDIIDGDNLVRLWHRDRNPRTVLIPDGRRKHGVCVVGEVLVGCALARGTGVDFVEVDGFGGVGFCSIVGGAAEDGAGPFAHEVFGLALDCELGPDVFGVKEDDFADAGFAENVGCGVDGFEPAEHFLLNVVGGEGALGGGLGERLEPFADSVEERVVEAGVGKGGVVEDGFDEGEELEFGDGGAAMGVVGPVEVGGVNHFLADDSDAFVFLGFNVLRDG